MKLPIIAIDLFCGGGGATEGLIRGGATVAVAVDNWEPALEVHKLNHPDVQILKFELGGNIPNTASWLRSFLPKDRNGFHLHIHGSPPCQMLSNANWNGNAEEGMNMVSWFIDLVEYMKADSWSMENVLPLAKRLDRDHPSILYQRINSADYGVPQKRKRVFAGEGWTLNPTHSKEQWVSVLERIPELIGATLEPAPSMKTRWANLTITQPFPTITSGSQSQIRFKRIHTFTMTPEQAGIIQGWEGMIFPKSMQTKTKRIIVGNMVCPPIMQRMVESIKEGMN